jgi:anti-sigma B factor antagonist
MAGAASSGGQLHIDIERREHVAIAHLSGSANMNVSSELWQQLVGLVDDRTNQIILDLSGLEFISSLGLGGIIAAHLRCRHHGSVVKLVQPAPRIRDLLNLTKLTKLFDVYDSVDEAISAA